MNEQLAARGPEDVSGPEFCLTYLCRVRLTEFRSLMDAHFGTVRAPSVAGDHVFMSLGDRTADQAIAAGVDPREVWFAVCDAFDVPDTLRWGLPD